MEDRINNLTGRSWKSQEVIEYHNHRGFTYDGFGQRSSQIQLRHKDITTLASGSGDKVEIWDGASWTDIIADEGEAAGEDSFMVEYANGVIHFYPPSGIKRGYQAIKVTYRQGISAVPKDIARACALMVGTQMYETTALNISPVGETPFQMDKGAILWRWDKEIKSILERYKRFRFF